MVHLVSERVKRWPVEKRWMMADIFDEVCVEYDYTNYMVTKIILIRFRSRY